MSVTVTTLAPTTRLTTKERIKEELSITVTTYDDLLDSLIDRAGATIETYCGRPFARQAYTELLPGYGGVELQLKHTPIAGTPTAVSQDSAVITDFTVSEADQGVLYRRNGWSATDQRYAGLAGGFRAFDFGAFQPGQYEPQFSVAYVAGYLLPPQDLINLDTISASSVDNSFNDSASGFPALLKAGDVVAASGFSTAANNGRFLVSGTPTTGKIVVTGGTLTTEAAAAGRTLRFQSLPMDVEKAAIETVKSWYASRSNDSNIVEKHVGQVGLRYSDPVQAGQSIYSLPVTVVGLLRPWSRAA